MAYSIDTYSGGKTFVVEDGTIDSSLDIKLIGKNYAGYGEVQNENFVHLTENFAGVTQPPRPLSGQIWYDTSAKKIKFYDAAAAKFRAIGGAEVADTAPTGLSTGDFWWDSSNKQLNTWNGTAFTLVGPQGLAGLGTTELKSEKVTDTTAAIHGIIKAFVNGDVVFVISSDEFTLSSESAITGFDKIRQGITLIDTIDADEGITSSDHAFWGTASNSLKLNGFTDTDFVKVDDYGTFEDAGFTVGDSDDLLIKIDTDGTTALIKNTQSSTIRFQTTVLTNTFTPLEIIGMDLLPGLTSVTDIGSTTKRFASVYADAFIGTASTATNADNLNVDGSYFLATIATPTIANKTSIVVRDSLGYINAGGFNGNATSATTAERANKLLVDNTTFREATVDSSGIGSPDTVAVRDGDGNLNANIFQGVATSALFADLAEKYLPDQEYDVGTVVSVGGDAEVTACNLLDRAFGAVSANPAFKMNDGLVGGVYIALKGRVPVKVIGAVKKGDKLIAAANGCAGAAASLLKNQTLKASNFPDTFAIALESNDDEGVKLVEAIII
jgi:hypothetical protein